MATRRISRANRPKGGNSTKFLPAVRDKIVKYIKSGNYTHVACAAAGVTPTTFGRWMDKAEEYERFLEGSHTDEQAESYKPYYDFRDEVREAESWAEVRITSNWWTKAQTDWQAGRDFLSRRHAERWAPQDKRRVTHEGLPPGQVNTQIIVEQIKGMSDAELIERMKQLNLTDGAMFGDAKALTSGTSEKPQEPFVDGEYTEITGSP